MTKDEARVIEGALRQYEDTLEECLKDKALEPVEREAFKNDLKVAQDLLNRTCKHKAISACTEAGCTNYVGKRN